MQLVRVDALCACLALTGLLGCGRGSSRARSDSLAFDPYHPPPADTLEPAAYEGWKQYRLVCDRCHGEEARGTTFGPDLLEALKPGGPVATREGFIALMVVGRPEKGMPPASRLGLAPEHFDGLYDYLHGRSTGRYFGGRPARRPS
jgi:hypothetical protein